MTFRQCALAATIVIALALGGVALGASTVAQHHTWRAIPMMGSHAMTPAASATRWHRFRGTVISANRAHRSFWMRTTTRRSVQIYTNRSTYWDDCGWGYMRYGYGLDVRAYRSHDHWMAAQMKSWGRDWMMP